MTGSMTSGVPDYQDPTEEAHRLLGSRKRSDREHGKELLQLMEQRQNRDTREREFNERAQDRRASEQDRQSQAKNRQDQLDLYREQLTEARNNRGEDVRSAHLNTLLADYNTKPEIRSAIENHLLKAAGVSATVPVDPKVAALARSKGLPEPQPTNLGGGEQTQSAQGQDMNISDIVHPVGAPNTSQLSLAGKAHYDPTLEANVQAGANSGKPYVVGAPDPSVGALAGSKTELLPNGSTKVSFPSGGTGITTSHVNPKTGRSRLQDYVDEETSKYGSPQSKPEFGVAGPESFRGHGAGSSFGETTGIGDIVSGKTTPEQQATGRPDILGTDRPGLGTLKSIGGFFAGEHPSPESVGAHPEIQPTARPGLDGAPSISAEGFARGNQKLGEIGQSLEPFTQAKNAVGSLFGGGQGGAKDIVKQPTPAPGTEFQGPVTAAASFAGAPLAPAPVPANTPPAIPPVNKPTPEEERRRMALQQ